MKYITLEIKDVTNHHYTSCQYSDGPLPEKDIALLEAEIHRGQSTGNGALRVRVDGSVAFFAYRHLIYVKVHQYDKER